MYWCRLRNTSFTLLFTYRTSTYGKVFSFDVRRRTAASTYVDVRWRTCGVWTLHYCIHLYCVYCCSFVMQTRGRMCYLNFLVDRIARPYDRLLVSWSRLSVCDSVHCGWTIHPTRQKCLNKWIGTATPLYTAWQLSTTCTVPIPSNTHL